MRPSWIFERLGGRPRATAALLLIAAATAGCAQLGAGARSEVSPFYRPSLVNYVAREGTFPLVVHGDPFDLPAGRTAEAVRGATTLPAWAQRAALVADRDAEEGRGLRLVIIFDPVDPNLTARRVCGNLDEVETNPPSGGLHVLAAFCRAGEWITDASLRGARPASPEDSAFRKFMDRVILAALPFFQSSGAIHGF